MKVQKRKVDVKRHTVKWKVAGKWMTRAQAYDLARKGKLAGVSAREREGVRFIQSLPNSPNLYDLPVDVEV